MSHLIRVAQLSILKGHLQEEYTHLEVAKAPAGEAASIAAHFKIFYIYCVFNQ